MNVELEDRQEVRFGQAGTGHVLSVSMPGTGGYECEEDRFDKGADNL